MNTETVNKANELLKKIEKVKSQLLVLDKDNPEKITLEIGEYVRGNQQDWQSRYFKKEKEINPNPMREAINEILEDAKERICIKFQKHLKQLQKEFDNL